MIDKRIADFLSTQGLQVSKTLPQKMCIRIKKGLIQTSNPICDCLFDQLEKKKEFDIGKKNKLMETLTKMELESDESCSFLKEACKQLSHSIKILSLKGEPKTFDPRESYSSKDPFLILTLKGLESKEDTFFLSIKPKNDLDFSFSVIKGHKNPPSPCKWHPSEKELFASFSSEESLIRLHTSNPHSKDLFLDSFKRPGPVKVTCLAWNKIGTFLASGTSEGFIQIRTKEGISKKAFKQGKTPIKCIKWNKNGDLILSCSSDDPNAYIWKWSMEKCIQTLKCFPEGNFVVDVDWKDEKSFACACVSTVSIYSIGDEEEPIENFGNFNQRVNDPIKFIKWDPSGSMVVCGKRFPALAYALGYKNYRLRLGNFNYFETHDLVWSNTGPGTPYPDKRLLLALASRDQIILWDTENVSGYDVAYKKVKIPTVFSLEFSPDNDYLASAGTSGLDVWKIDYDEIDKLIENQSKTTLRNVFKHQGNFVGVSWSKNGDKIAASAKNGDIHIVSFDPKKCTVEEREVVPIPPPVSDSDSDLDLDF